MLALIIVLLGANQVRRRFARSEIPIVGTVAEILEPFLIVNPYGLFAIEDNHAPGDCRRGSDDGKIWREYELRYKPGKRYRELRRGTFLINRGLTGKCGSPRSTARTHRRGRWSLIYRLLQNSPPVVSMLRSNPFPDRPPKYMRALLYDYRFADPQTHAATGHRRVRRLDDVYFPAVSLAEFEPAQ